MGYVVAQAGLEHAEALARADRPAVAVGQGDGADTALEKHAGAARQQHKPDQAEIADQEIIGDVFQRRLLGRRPDVPRRKVVFPPHRIFAEGCDASSALVEAEQRQRRDQHRGSEQERRGAIVKRLHPQPEVKADAAMHPGNGHDRGHQPYPGWLRDPERIKLLRIELLLAEQRLSEPRADDVRGDQRGDAQTEHKLQWFDRLPAELPALVQRPESKA